MNLQITNCPNRIKPLLLREQKTETLLIFIRYTLENYFRNLSANESENISHNMDTAYVESQLRSLLSFLQEHIVEANYIKKIIIVTKKDGVIKTVSNKEEPLYYYYQELSKQLEISVPNGTAWIPEQLVICLLSEWTIEEQKSCALFPFLNNYDYLEILNRFDKARLLAKKKNNARAVKAVAQMYDAGSQIVKRLKKAKYKHNKNRVSKKRK